MTVTHGLADAGLLLLGNTARLPNVCRGHTAVCQGVHLDLLFNQWQLVNVANCNLSIVSIIYGICQGKAFLLHHFFRSHFMAARWGGQTAFGTG